MEGGRRNATRMKNETSFNRLGQEERRGTKTKKRSWKKEAELDAAQLENCSWAFVADKAEKAVRAGKVACKAVGGRLPFKSGINQLRLHELEFLDLVKLRHFCSF